MKKKIKKDSKLGLIALVFFVPVILTIIFILDWDPNNAVIMGSIIGALWLFAILIVVFELRSAKKHPYPLFYLLYYDDLISNKIPHSDGSILIELCDSGNSKLDEYKANHPELIVQEYIEKLSSQL